jgi:nitrous oxidase accessory protein NosD
MITAAVALAAPLAIGVTLSAHAAPATIVVDDDGQGSAADCNDATPAQTTVQGGVNAAAATDTVLVCPGTYTEQVTIQKELTLEGTDEAGVVIKAPGSLVSSTCAPSVGTTIVDICGGATVGLNTLTVSGPRTSDELDYGVLVTGGATIHASNATIQDIRDDPLSGGQHGVALRIGSGPAGQVGHGTVNGVTVKRYQKTGLEVDGPGTDATLTDNVVQGVGPSTAIAQNGVQISRSAGASVTGNSVLSNECDAPSCGPDPATDTESAGILLFQPDAATTTLSSNTIAGNDMGVYNLQTDTDTGTATIASNVILSNRYVGVFLDQGHAALNANYIIGPSNVGVEAYSFNPSGQKTGGVLTGNRIGRDVADVEIQQDPGAQGVTVSGSNNSFLGTGQGVVNGTGTFVDFSNNYWGATSGPSDWSTGTGTKVSPDIHFFPWYTTKAMTTLAQCSSGPTSGNDILCGTPGNNTINGGGGNDLIIGYGGNDTLNGGPGNDAIMGYAGNDTLSGGPDADSIQGLSGNDTCDPGTGPGDQVSSCESGP